MARTKLSLGRCGQYAIYCPSSFQSVANCVMRKSSVLRPCRDTLRLAIVSQDAICSRVALLFASSGPPAIVRAIPQRIVNTFERMLRGWSGPHISAEVLKGFVPPLTDGYPPATVIGEVRRCRQGASLSHGLPNGVFLGVGHSMNACPDSVGARLATTRSSSQQIRGLDWFLAPAFAAAKPHGLAPRIARMIPQDGPGTKLQSGQVFEPVSVLDRIGVVHQIDLSVRLRWWKGPIGNSNFPSGRFIIAPSAGNERGGF